MGYKYYNQQEVSGRYDSGTYADSGCGATSCAMLAHKHNTKWNPKTVGAWMTAHGHATIGTTWVGIRDFFNANGMKCIMYGNVTDQYGKTNGVPQKQWKSAMRKGTGTGILLMGRSMFTSGAHYIVIRAIKKQKNGNYKYLVFDPYTKAFCRWMDWSAFSGKVKQFYYVDATWKSKSSTKSLNGYKCGKEYTALTARPVRKSHAKKSEKVGTVKKGAKRTFTKLFRTPVYLWGKTDKGWCAIKKLDNNKKYFK